MMRLILRLSCTFLLFSLISCHSGEEALEIPDMDRYKVSIDVAQNLASSLNMQDPYTTISNSNYRTANHKEIDWIQPLANAEGDIGCYIINFQNNEGFVILSGDYRAVPVFAYGDHGSFPAPGEPINKGLALLLMQAMDHVDAIRDSIPEITAEMLAMWSGTGIYGAIQNPEACNCSSATLSLECMTYCEQNPSGGGGGPLDGDGSGSSVTVLSTHGPLLRTRWGQDGIYNDAAPVLGCARVRGDTRALTGCVATAMAQVMRYHRAPGGFNWDAMPINDDDGVPNADLARLMRLCGDEVGMDYGCESSSAHGHKIKGAFKNLGYKDGINYDAFDKTEVVRQIQSYQPVILTGCSIEVDFIFVWPILDAGCHAWVCDGYKQRVVTSANGILSSTYYEELHMNWGWEDNNLMSNTWTANFTATDGTRFNFLVKMVKDIRPK